MARRFFLLVLLAGAFAVPADAETIPRPTVGFVRLGICNETNGCFAGQELTGWVEFAGGVHLEDGTSHFGTFGLHFQAHEECGPHVCRYVFGNSPIAKEDVTVTNLPLEIFPGIGVEFGRQVTGWCSGSLIQVGQLLGLPSAALEARFACHLETPQGWSGDRKLLATLVLDPYCQAGCAGMGGPSGPDEYLGAYTQGDASLPV